MDDTSRTNTIESFMSVSRLTQNIEWYQSKRDTEQISKTPRETDIIATWQFKEKRIKWHSHNTHLCAPIRKWFYYEIIIL